MKKIYLGVDVGSVSCNVVAIDENKKLLAKSYIRTQGQPIRAVKEGLAAVKDQLHDCGVAGVGTTGSGRMLASILVGGDIVKNEITSHAMAALSEVPGVRTVLEIGGQDSKIIILEGGMVTDFAMNTVCAAGTGSFLDHQAARLGMDIEEFGDRALQSRNPVRVTGKCTVFAESDMIQKQQMGHRTEDILYGLCQALARNYLSNVGLGKEIRTPVVFQGGVAFNQGMVRAFREALETNEVIVPPHHEAMGAIGAAILALEEMRARKTKTEFKGFEVSEAEYTTSPFECQACPNLCEIAQISLDGQVIARYGGRCDIWERKPTAQTAGA